VKRERFLSDMIDPTAFLVDFIENYITGRSYPPQNENPV